MYYWATVVFGRTDKQFWNMTLTQLNSLIRTHNIMHGHTDAETKAPPEITSDQAPALLAALAGKRLQKPPEGH